MAKTKKEAPVAAAMPTFAEVEVKRQEMLASLTAVAAAMTVATNSIKSFTDLSNALPFPAASANTSADTSAETNGADGKRKRKEKEPRDPNKPQRPGSAYLKWQSAARSALHAENPDMPNKAFTGLLQEKWQNLPEEEKRRYTAEADKEMAIWKQAMHAYHETLPLDQQPKSMQQEAKKAAKAAGKAVAAPVAAAVEVDEVEEDEVDSDAGSTDSSDESEDGSDSSAESDDTVPPPPPAKKSKKSKGDSAVAAPIAPATPVAPASTKKQKKDKK